MSTYLMGDEDGGVTLYCKADKCLDDGRPLAHYEIGYTGQIYEWNGLVMPIADSIEHLAYLARQHMVQVHHAV